MSMTVETARQLIARIQAAICMVNQEELLEQIALSLTEQEFDELCEDFQGIAKETHREVCISRAGGMYILGMPLLIRTMRQ